MKFLNIERGNNIIDEQRTLELFGYTSNELSQQSGKPIIRVCEECGKYDKIKFQNYKNIKNPDLCKICSYQYKFKLPKPKFVKEEDRFIEGTQIDRILTIEKFDYDPINLSKGSGRKIIRVCQKCNEIKILNYKSCTNLCLSCAGQNKIVDEIKCGQKISDSLMGHKLSDETKLKIGKANKGKNMSMENRIKQSCRLQNIDTKDFNGFIKNQPYCKKFNELLKEQIRIKYNRECFICNKDEVNNNRRLDVHHIDMNKNQGCNNIEWKLIPVCQICHNRLHNNLWQSRIEYLLSH